MAVRNVRSVAVRSHSVLRSNVLRSSKGRRSNNKHLRQQKESGLAAVAAVVAAANQQNLPRPTRMQPPRSNRGRRASRVRRARPRPRARILSLLARMAERRAPRVTVPNGGDVSAGAAVVGVVVVDQRPRRHSCGCAALSVVGYR